MAIRSINIKVFCKRDRITRSMPIEWFDHPDGKPFFKDCAGCDSMDGQIKCEDCKKQITMELLSIHSIQELRDLSL